MRLMLISIAMCILELGCATTRVPVSLVYSKYEPKGGKILIDRRADTEGEIKQTRQSELGIMVRFCYPEGYKVIDEGTEDQKAPEYSYTFFILPFIWSATSYVYPERKFVNFVCDGKPKSDELKNEGPDSGASH